MEHLDGILKLVDSEFEAVNKNGKFRSREEIDSVYKLVDIVKDVYEIWKCEDEMNDGEYSGNYAYEQGGRMNRGGSYYDGGNSYARGRGRNARRDSMGRYSRNSYRMNGMGDMGGYSRADKHEYMENLRDMMESAPDEQTRQSLKRMIDGMDK